MNTKEAITENIYNRRQAELIGRLIAADCELFDCDRKIGYFQQFAYINDAKGLLESRGDGISIDEFFNNHANEFGNNLFIKQAIKANGIERLYSSSKDVKDPEKLTHQAKILYHLCSYQSPYRLLCCCLPQFSGRTTASLIAMYHTLLGKMGSVLFVAPSVRRADLIARRVTEFLESTLWHTILTVGKFYGDHESVEEAITNVGIATPEGLHEKLLSPRIQARQKEFLADIELIVFDGCDSYYGTYGSHCALVFRRLRRVLDCYGAAPKFYSIMSPHLEAFQFCQTLFGFDNLNPDREFLFIGGGQNSKERPCRSLTFWCPPFHFTGSSRSDSVYDLDPKRDTLGAGLPNLMNALAVTLSRLPQADASSDKVRNSSNKLILLSKNRIFTSDDGANLVSANGWQVDVVQALNELDERLDYDKRVLIIAGYPNSLPSLFQDIAHFGEEGAMIIVALDNDPLSQYLLKKVDQLVGDSLLRHGGQLTGGDDDAPIGRSLPVSSQVIRINPDNSKIAEVHLRFAERELPGLSPEEASRYFGVTAQHIMQKETFRKSSNREAPTVDFHCVDWMAGKQEDNLIPVFEQHATNQIGWVEKKTAAFKTVPGMTFFKNGHRYIVHSKDEEKVRVKVVDKLQNREPLTAYDFDFDPAEINVVYKKLVNNKPNGLRLQLGLGPVFVKQKVLGYMNYDFYNYFDPKIVTQEPFATSEFVTTALLIRFCVEGLSQHAIHALKHLIKILLPTLIKYDKPEIEVVLYHRSDKERNTSQQEWDIVMFDNHPYGDCYARYLYGLDAGSWKQLLEYAYDLLQESPGGQPNWHSLYLPDCRDPVYLGDNAYGHNHNLDQQAAFDFLGKELEKHGHDIEMKLKYGISKNEISSAVVFKKLNNYKRIILQVLRDRCMFHINESENESDTVMIRLLDSKHPRLAYFSNNIIWVKGPEAGLTEKDYIGILAHEFVHYWQRQNPAEFTQKLIKYNMENVEDPENIPFQGKLFSEGIANWGQYKVLDFYGLEDAIKQLKPDAPGEAGHPDFDAYDLGFRLMLHLEYNCDFARMLYFLMSGEIDYTIDVDTGRTAFLSTASDYKMIYEDSRLSIGNMMTQVGEYYLSQLDIEGYEKIKNHDRELAEDYPRTTYLSMRVFKKEEQPALEIAEDHPVQERPELLNPDYTIKTLLEEASQDNLESGQNTLYEELAKKGFWLLDHELNEELSLVDFCHLNSSDKHERSTTELLKFVVEKLFEVKSGKKDSL